MKAEGYSQEGKRLPLSSSLQQISERDEVKDEKTYSAGPYVINSQHFLGHTVGPKDFQILSGTKDFMGYDFRSFGYEFCLIDGNLRNFREVA